MKRTPFMQQSVDSITSSLFGISNTDAITQHVCGCCKKPITGFKDELSAKEYTISAMCQECQDLTFVEPDE